jgi:AcrR family transcriptional regulator
MASQGLTREGDDDASKPMTDGRRQRREHNKRRVFAAFLALVEEGVVSPTAHDVARQAEVGLRSVFRHFSDMEELYRGMASQVEAELSDALLQRCSATDWEGQIAEISRRRANAYESGSCPSRFASRPIPMNRFL